MEAVHQTNDKNTSTVNLSSMEAFNTTQLLSALKAELNNLNSIHMSYAPLIQAATQLLKERTFI